MYEVYSVLYKNNGVWSIFSHLRAMRSTAARSIENNGAAAGVCVSLCVCVVCYLHIVNRKPSRSLSSTFWRPYSSTGGSSDSSGTAVVLLYNKIHKARVKFCRQQHLSECCFCFLLMHIPLRFIVCTIRVQWAWSCSFVQSSTTDATRICLLEKFMYCVRGDGKEKTLLRNAVPQ